MTVEPSTAAGSYTHAGNTYFFCSHHCLAKFKANPGEYVGDANPAPPKERDAGVMG